MGLELSPGLQLRPGRKASLQPLTPLFDTTYVMTLRLARGHNPFLGSPDHLAVRLQRVGWSAPSIALAAYGLTVVTSAAGLLLLFLPPHLAPWPVVSVVALLLVVGGLLARVDVGAPRPESVTGMETVTDTLVPAIDAATSRARSDTTHVGARS